MHLSLPQSIIVAQNQSLAPSLPTGRRLSRNPRASPARLSAVAFGVGGVAALLVAIRYGSGYGIKI